MLFRTHCRSVLLPAVGSLFSPTVGALLFFCGSRRPSISSSRSSSSFASASTIHFSLTHSSGFLFLGSSITVMFTRSPGFLSSGLFVVSHVTRLCFSSASVSRRLGFAMAARPFTCCTWSAGLTSTTLLSLRALRVEVFDSRARLLRFCASPLTESLSVDAIVLCVFRFGLRGALPPKLSVDATLRSCRRCAWLRASWSVGTSRRRDACT